MKNLLSRLIPLSLLVALVGAMFPVTVFAQTSVTGVSPNPIVNNVANTVTITGTGFDNTATVNFDGAAVASAFVNATTVTATIPAGKPAGTYVLEVFVGGVSAGTTNLSVDDPPPPPTATFTPSPTATATLPFVRPQFVVRSTKTSGNIRTGGEFKLTVVVENAGTSSAYSAQAVFASADLIPTKNGGVSALGVVGADKEISINQSFYVSAQVVGSTILVADLTITYYDESGSTFSDKFTLSIPVSGGVTTGGGAVAATATPTGVKTSQLVIRGYSTDVDPLQPGEMFNLKLDVVNVGNAKANRITMIVGGGSSGGSGGGTPQPGGVSGGSGDFANFAPVGASNVQSLGDLGAQEDSTVTQKLIVNVNTAPGAYPMRIAFSYLNDKNEVINDEQVITLLVYSLPRLDVSFYRPPDPFFVGQGGALPIQVVNLGKRLSVLGNIKITSQQGTIENGTSLVGSLDAGGYFTIDSFFMPEQSGTVTLNIVIDYVDDFNQPRTIEKTMEVEVMEGFVEEPVDPSLNGGGGGGGEEFPVMTEETVWQKIWRFILGLLGLDSSAPSDGGAPVVDPGMEQPIQVKPGTGKG